MSPVSVFLFHVTAAVTAAQRWHIAQVRCLLASGKGKVFLSEHITVGLGHEHADGCECVPVGRMQFEPHIFLTHQMNTFPVDYVDFYGYFFQMSTDDAVKRK